MLGGGVFGAFLKIWKQSSENRHERMLAGMKIDQLNAKLISEARQNNEKGFSWTRRVIAISCVLVIVILPKVAAFFNPEIAIWVSAEVLDPGFMFFTEDKTITEWNRLTGIVITPMDNMMVSAIIGMYFGASIAKR